MRSISFLLTVIYVLLSNFEVHFSPRYGNCFSFNSNVSGSLESLWSSTRPGSLMGLNVVLNTQQSVYMRSSVHHFTPEIRDHRALRLFYCPGWIIANASL